MGAEVVALEDSSSVVDSSVVVSSSVVVASAVGSSVVAVSSSGGAPVSAGSVEPGSVSPSTDSGGSFFIESLIEASVHSSRYSQSGFPEKVTSCVIG